MAIKSKQRKEKHGEVFTPPQIVDQMLERIDERILYNPTKTFLDPTCGNGNILLRIFQRRCEHGCDPLKSISTLYGVDIQHDNVIETRERLIVELQKYVEDVEDVSGVEQTLRDNIILGDATTIDYSTCFDPIDEEAIFLTL